MGLAGQGGKIPVRLRDRLIGPGKENVDVDNELGDVVDSTDCTGNHDVMARQVGPWMAKPAIVKALSSANI